MKIYRDDFDAPEYFDDLAPAATTPAPRQEGHGLRNWQKFMLCYSLIMAGGALVLYAQGGLLTAVTGLAIWLLTAAIILASAGKAGRL